MQVSLTSVGLFMRLLWIDQTTRHDRYDDWLHWRFAKAIRKHTDIFFYAPYIHEREPSFTPIHYQKSLKLKDIVDELKIDCVILNTKGSAFFNYLPDILYHEKHTGSTYWLPNDFKKCDVLKICIEEDFQYETTYNWHEEHGFKAVLQKHVIHTLKTGGLDRYLFPFSVDTDVFKPSGRPRQAKVGFAGTQRAGNAISGGSVYRPREMAYDTIRSLGYLAGKTTPAGERIEGQAYVDYLQEYIAYLSCGSIYNLTPAKMFEIMASGGVLLTNKTYGLDRLFPEDTYITYEEDGMDLKPKLEQLFADKEYRDGIVERALTCIREKHTHDIRIKWLLEIINIYL